MHNFKASEFQMSLLYYAIPCHLNFPKAIYKDHFASLTFSFKFIHKLRQLYIYFFLHWFIKMTFQFLNLNHTQDLLNTVYEQFYDQYEANNTTLNLHNIGEHLLCYVRKLGSFWVWSCFSFVMKIRMVHCWKSSWGSECFFL